MLLRFMRIRLEYVKLSSMQCFLNKQLLLIIIMVYFGFRGSENLHAKTQQKCILCFV